MKAVHLKTEYLIDPIGIDIRTPRFSWNVSGGKKQSAYQLRAVDEKGRLLFDSGKVESERMHRILYKGEPLKSREQVFWNVTLWDENGTKGEPSADAKFEMGLLDPEDWKASWIRGDYHAFRRKRYPVDCFRKQVNLAKGKTVFSARLYATALGLYEIRINGEKCGDFCLAPGYTDYRKRVQYQTILVDDLVKKAGSNFTLTAELADGWYRGSIGAHGMTCQYGTVTRLLAQLEIRYTDGTTEIVKTDDSWEWSNDGPIRFADNKDGEICDARCTPSYSKKARLSAYEIVPTASNNVPVKEMESFTPEKSISPSGKLICDFGQNLAGYLSFSVMAHAGDQIDIRCGEMLGKDGELSLANIQTNVHGKTSPLQEIHYTCREGRNEYKTKFAIFGFQYAEIQMPRELYDTLEIRNYAVYSQIRETGFFTSSNDYLNRFVEATKWSTKSNSTDIPTDCPTRERHGWTGDAQIFFESANYLFDYAAFSKKFLRDVYDWQKPSGKLPQIAPYGGVDFYMGVMNGAVGWSDIGVLVPYRFYKLYDDRTILEENYEGMKAYAQFMQKRCGAFPGLYAIYNRPTGVKKYKKYLSNVGQDYDEWAEPQDVCSFVWTDFARNHPEVRTAYTSYIMDLMVEIAGVLGKTEDIPGYQEYADGCRKAYQELVSVNPEYSLDTDRQARLVRPLYMHLLNPQQEEFAKKRLLAAMEHYGYRLGTGFLSTPFILYVLSGLDLEAAYRLLENEEIPGWLSMPKAGATTIWESWEGSAASGEVASLNHYSKGALCEWLFKGMCGISVDGENRFLIRPLPGGHFTYAFAEYESVFGKVTSGWEKREEGYAYRIEIPANTTAEVQLPDGRDLELEAGEWNL